MTLLYCEAISIELMFEFSLLCLLTNEAAESLSGSIFSGILSRVDHFENHGVGHLIPKWTYQLKLLGLAHYEYQLSGV